MGTAHIRTPTSVLLQRTSVPFLTVSYSQSQQILLETHHLVYEGTTKQVCH